MVHQHRGQMCPSIARLVAVINLNRGCCLAGEATTTVHRCTHVLHQAVTGTGALPPTALVRWSWGVQHCIALQKWQAAAWNTHDLYASTIVYQGQRASGAFALWTCGGG